MNLGSREGINYGNKNTQTQNRNKGSNLVKSIGKVTLWDSECSECLALPRLAVKELTF
jgi:hypothetical protein